MRRRIIKQGEAFTCTLPIDWVRKHKLAAGDEVDIDDSQKNLVITTGEKKAVECAKLSMTSMNEIIERIIPAMYRAGYDEIEVTHKGPAMVKYLQHILERELIGYQIVEQGKEHCIIKEISRPEQEVFPMLLRRCFLLVLSSAEQCSDALKQKDANALKDIIQLDRSINRLTNLCERLLVTKSAYTTKESMFQFHFLKELENIADEYKFLAEYHINSGSFERKGVAMLDEINAILARMHALFYNFSMDEATLILDSMKTIKKKLISYQGDVIFMYHLMSIFRRLHTMISGHFSLNL